MQTKHKQCFHVKTCRESVVGRFLDNHLLCVYGEKRCTLRNHSVYDVVHRPHQCIYSHSSYLENY